MKSEKFEEYFLKYRNLVIRVVMDKTGDYQLAQEICQQVFLALYTNMEKVRPDLVKAWLIRCTQNAVIDYFRKSKTKKEFISDTSVSEAGNILMEESMEIFVEKKYNSELAGKILNEVRTVNEKWFEVLVLNCVEGLSYAEVAEVLNISEPVLRARMHRARNFIKKRFGAEYLNKE
ncbi:MAG: RNA polymerase sigma factor [Candidatus Choladocola sp.]|nr:RNA polymerase sigma factor [Candidatus Choladocola sp.]